MLIFTFETDDETRRGYVRAANAASALAAIGKPATVWPLAGDVAWPRDAIPGRATVYEDRQDGPGLA